MIRCPSCTSEVPEQSRYCLTCGTVIGQRSPASTLATVAILQKAPPVTSSALDEGRFPPGTLLAGRYRIVGMLGRGGMGEVYRANDLKLGQPVAIKFLPVDMADNPRMMERFHGEVRIARQVSHPNVCRVYDIGEAEGAAFLTMEYVDGEDLASLLRRIGRLPGDKAVEMARRLCAGLAAAHDKGVLHRDLKPANVMIDGRGHVLITDFGLAGFAGQVEGGEIRNGTPAYMAPEQLAGTEVSVRSDVYALGLVLYEMFTGRHAYTDPADRTSHPSVTSLVKDLDPAVERVIDRCLQQDPKLRPASALAVAGALPGGDPLAAALAAGETPTPEMVAAAGEIDGIGVRAAAIYFGLVLAGLIAVVLVGSRAGVVEQTPFETPPDALAHKSRELLQKLGYTERPADRAWGFAYAWSFRGYARRHEKPATYAAQLAKGLPAPVYFWYRQGPQALVPLRAAAAVSANDPPLTQPGMASVNLDPSGRLMDLRAIPPERDASHAAGPVDWSVLLNAAGVDLARFHPVEPEWLPLVTADVRAAWLGSYAHAPEVPIRLEASAWHGRPVYFQVVGPWTIPATGHAVSASAAQKAGQWIWNGVVLTLFVIAAAMAWTHFRSGRGDLHGALRLGAGVLAAQVLAWVGKAHHTLTTDEYAQFQSALGVGLFLAGAYFVWYGALEPHVRRRWPHSLISWTRLLGGAARDPLVGGHVLLGCLLGVGYTLLFLTAHLAGKGDDFSNVDLTAFLDVFARTSTLLKMAIVAVGDAMALFFFYFLFRVLLRKEWLAATAAVVLYAVYTALSAEALVVTEIGNTIVMISAIWILTRFGLLPMIVAILVSSVLPGFPMTTDFSTWYAGNMFFALGVVLALAAYAFHTALAGRPVFASEVLER